MISKKSYKVACLGNMNNLIAPTAQYLASKGYEVDLFLLYEYEHFSPLSDYLDIKDIKFNIRNIEMNFGGVMEINKSKLKVQLSDYDFYIGTDYAPALLARINIRLDVFVWAGTDLYEWPFYHSKYVIPQSWELNKLYTSKLQYEGIKKSRFMPMSLNNDFIINAVKKTNFQGEIFNPLPFINYSYFENANIPIPDEFTKIRNNYNILLVYHGRQWWKTASPEFTKGNDMFINGFGEFVKSNPNIKIGVMLLEYGQDVQNSKALIQELGLEKNVVWVPKQLRKNLLQLLKIADIGVGQFGNDGAFLYCSNAEIIFSKIPLLAFRDDEFNLKHGYTLFPMLNANSSEEIKNQLNYFINNKEECVKMSDMAYNWLMQYNFNEPIGKLTHILRQKSGNVDILPLSSILKIKLYRIKLFIFKIINAVVLKTRNNYLRKRILEWEK